MVTHTVTRTRVVEPHTPTQLVMPQILAHPIPDRSAHVSHAPATPKRSACIPASPRTPACTPTNNSNAIPPASAQVPRTPVHAHAMPTAATPGPLYCIPHPAELEVPTPRTGRGKYYVIIHGEEVGIWGDWYIIFLCLIHYTSLTFS
jgi:hypothetical protein